MRPLEIGDRVVFFQGITGAEVGETGTIVDIVGRMVRVKCDNGHITGHHYYRSDSRFIRRPTIGDELLNKGPQSTRQTPEGCDSGRGQPPLDVELGLVE